MSSNIYPPLLRFKNVTFKTDPNMQTNSIKAEKKRIFILNKLMKGNYMNKPSKQYISAGTEGIFD